VQGKLVLFDAATKKELETYDGRYEDYCCSISSRCADQLPTIIAVHATMSTCHPCSVARVRIH
jgi:hypothetical protein